VPWRPGRWVPVDPDWAFAPLLRVRAALDPARPWSGHGTVLAGLAAACGLGFRLAQHAPPAGLAPHEAAGQLDFGLRELITQAQAAVDGAVLSPTGCPACGRLPAACTRRPCTARRHAAAGHGDRRGAADPAGPR
jgi:hypothetical protein